MPSASRRENSVSGVAAIGSSAAAPWSSGSLVRMPSLKRHSTATSRSSGLGGRELLAHALGRRDDGGDALRLGRHHRRLGHPDLAAGGNACCMISPQRSARLSSRTLERGPSRRRGCRRRARATGAGRRWSIRSARHGRDSAARRGGFQTAGRPSAAQPAGLANRP